jgi:extracellular factor (EF) 3-hydroxypalmitic acid methyl ester biosynthesis protein
MISLFHILSDATVDWIIQNTTELRIDAGEVLVREGTHIASMYIVTEGLLGVHVGPLGRKPISLCGPGAVVGEQSFIENQTTSASLVAQEQTHLLELPRQRLMEKTASDSVFAADFYRAIAMTLSQRLRAISQAQRETRSGQKPTFDDVNFQSAWLLMSEFKRMLVAADHESIKTDGVSEATYQSLWAKCDELQKLSHKLLGDGSPLSDYLREQLGAQLQTEILPYVLLTSTIERCYSKPRGYAGDYYTIERIYNNKPEGAGRIGAVVDRLFLELPAAIAVRNRRALLAEEIFATVDSKRGEMARVLSLACGPAREIADVFAKIPDKTKLLATCLDIDLQALAFVSDWRDKSGLKSRIQLLNQNLISLALGRAKLDLPPQDLVYSIGLIDYFDDRLVVKMLDFIYQVLAPGGRVILGNFHPRNQTKALMDYLLEWRLIHRSEQDMDRLFQSSKFARGTTKIRFEEQGVNLFAECIKDAVQ